ncbi:hypothetical protein LLH00_06595 [bacterium]|nr:hypothetical protein [bacterium]
MKAHFLSLFLIALSGLLSPALPEKAPEFDRPALHAQALEESLTPVRPGAPGKFAFWNVNASQFIYAPAFDFSPVAGAVAYRFSAVPDSSGKGYVFQAQEPWAALAPIWNDLPVGYVDLEVSGLDKAGKTLGTAGKRRFYRSAAFDGPYREDPQYNYCKSAQRALGYLFHHRYLQSWITTGAPDSAYFLYCYPSKMEAAIIEGMLLYSRLAPQDSAGAMTVAINAGKYLIAHSLPAGSPLEFFPPTYDPSFLDQQARKTNDASLLYRDQLMLSYPSQAALAYLDLYGVTADTSLLNAAVRIAGTYARIQLADGNWPLKMDIHTGKAVASNYVRVGPILELFTRLKTDFGIERYSGNYQAAWPNYLRPFESFNFEGQFEDVEPSKPYYNLTHYGAVDGANYYLDHATENPENLGMAREYLRFAEDQFVVWERPSPSPGPEWRKKDSSDWVTPCALEQYDYYVPIDGSAANFIDVFLKAYRVTGDRLFLAKAVSLANSMVTVQNETGGHYPTYWWRSRYKLSDRFGWINCSIASAKTMYRLGAFLEQQGDDGSGR